MAILKNRPLFSACLLYIICIFCARMTPASVKIGIFFACTGLLLVCLTLSLLRKLPKKIALRAGVCLLCTAIAFGSAYLTFDYGQQTYERIAQKESCTIKATVTERTASEFITICRVRVQQIDQGAQHFDAQLICTFPSYLQVGDSFTATVAPATLEQLDSALHDTDYALADGLRMQFTCENEADVQMVETEAFLPVISLSELNDSLCRIMLKFCGKESGGLACALLLGNKSYLSLELSRDFGRAGASHMLALSGMHVSILIGALGFLLGKLHVHRKARIVFLVVASVGYLLLTGMSVSATRAVAMVCILQLSYLLAADNDTLTTLGLVGAVILLLDPYSVCDAGFILSFLATFGIVVLVPPLHAYLTERTDRMCQPPHRNLKLRVCGAGASVLETLLIGVIAAFAVMVPSCYLVGNVSLFSPLTTLLLSPLVSGMLVAGSALLLLCPIPAFAHFFATLIRLLYALMLPYIEGVSGIDGALLPLTYDTVRVLSVLLCLFLFVLLILPLRRKVLLALPPALLCISFCIFYPINAMYQESYLRAAYSHPSNVSEALVCADGYRAYICDLSSGTGTSLYNSTYAAAQLHTTEIGAILLTDYHTLHVSSLSDTVQRQKTDLLYLPLTTDPDDLDVQHALCDLAARHNLTVAFYEYGTPVAWFDGTVLTVHRTDLSRSEQPALVVTLEREDACLSLISAAAQHTVLGTQAADAAAKADALVIPERGPVPRLSCSLPIAAGADVVFGTRELASYCDPESLAQVGSIITDPEFVYFTLACKGES